MLLEDVLEEYIYHCISKNYSSMTIKNKKQEYKRLKEYLIKKRGITELENITVHDLKAYFRAKQKSGLQSSSLVTMTKNVSAFFNFCVKEEYITENPMKKVERPKVQQKVISGFSDREVQNMLNAYSNREYLDIRNKAIIAMLADSGLRAMEIRGLKNSDVRETTILVNGKGDKQRIVFISPILKKILIRYERLKKEYFDERFVKDDCYFLTYQGRGITHNGLDKVIKQAGKRAGIEGKRLSPHTFRHYFSVKSLQSGIDVYSLSRLLGHSDISVTQRYLQTLTDEQLSEKAISSSPLMNLGGHRNVK